MKLRKKNRKRKWCLRKKLEFMIALAILWYMGKASGILNVLYPYHAAYEYRSDIANYKEGAAGEYYQEFPNEAKDIKWICFPSLMQGSGYDALFFYADSDYVKGPYEKYSVSATKYCYSNYGWENGKTGKTVTFPKINDMTEEEKSDTTVFVTYDNENPNHPHSSGVYINQTEGYVCFFTQ